MGSGAYSTKDWASFSSSRKLHDASTKTEDIYKSKSIDDSLDPKKFSFRESVDGPDNPESTPLIIALDVTGSMTAVLDSIARKGLKTVCEEVYNRKPISNPHICCLGIGDVEYDRCPFQATQFEADIRIFEQLEKVYLERGGGGNSYESYILAWYFAKFRTKSDSFSKRCRKGFIFTIGDEQVTPGIESSHFERFMGDKQVSTYTAKQLFDLVCKEWDVFHIVIKEGSHCRYDYDGVMKSWQSVISPQRVLSLDDHTKIGETIVTTLEMSAGKTFDEAVSSWDGSTALSVGRAVEAFADGSIAVRRDGKNIDRFL